MRPVFVFVLSLALAGAIHAQNAMRPGPVPPAAQNGMPPMPPPMPATPPDGMGRSGQASAATPPPRPSSWRGSDADWQAHVRTCQQGRQGYDSATDQYRDHSGAMRTCPR